jgi:hypothetical protein
MELSDTGRPTPVRTPRAPAAVFTWARTPYTHAEADPHPLVHASRPLLPCA